MPSNVIYPNAKQHMLSGNVDLTGTIYVTLISSSYSYSAGHEFYDPIVAAHQVGSTGSLISQTLLSGTLDGADLTFSSVAAGSSVTSVIVFQSGTAGSSDYLVAHYDTGSEGAVSIDTNGGDITVNWNASGLFSL